MTYERLTQICQGAEKAFGRPGVTARQYVVLRAIQADPGKSQAKYCTVTCIDRSTMAAVIDRLSKNDLIDRTRSKSDRRACVLDITPKGRTALFAAGDAYKAMQAYVAERMQDTEAMAA